MEYTKEDQQALGKARKLRAKESDVIGKKGYWRKYRPDGSYEWGYKFKPNDGHGKLSRAGNEVWEMMRPSIEADNARMANLQARAERVTMRSTRGFEYVLPDQADATAKRNGWTHHWRAGGLRVERGQGTAMLFRETSQGWEPLGVRCLGTPLKGRAEVPCRGVVRGPDGVAWAARSGRWVMVGD